MSEQENREQEIRAQRLESERAAFLSVACEEAVQSCTGVLPLNPERFALCLAELLRGGYDSLYAEFTAAHPELLRQFVARKEAEYAPTRELTAQEQDRFLKKLREEYRKGMKGAC